MLEGPLAALGASTPAWMPWLAAIVGFALGLLGCAYLAVVEWGAWTLLMPNRRPGSMMAGQDPVLGVPIETVASDGVALAGLWHAADVPTGRTVVLLHGF